jgi:hypothetical protein
VNIHLTIEGLKEMTALSDIVTTLTATNDKVIAALAAAGSGAAADEAAAVDNLTAENARLEDALAADAPPAPPAAGPVPSFGSPLKSLGGPDVTGAANIGQDMFSAKADRPTGSTLPEDAPPAAGEPGSAENPIHA